MLSLGEYRKELREKWKAAICKTAPMVRVANLATDRAPDFMVDTDEWNVDDYNLFDSTAYKNEEIYLNEEGQECIHLKAMCRAVDDLIDNGACDSAWHDYAEVFVDSQAR